jgi:hypothetical protein
MPHDHAESKTVGESANSTSRAKGGPAQSAKARAVLSLQNQAGNRALAQLLGPAANKVNGPRAGQGALSVQRDAWTDALEKELGTAQKIDFDALARALVRTSRARGVEPSVEPKKSVPAKPGESSGTGTSATGTSPEGSAVPISETSVAHRKAALAEREKRLEAGGATDLERENQRLDLRDQTLKLKELRRPKTPLEMAIRDKDEERQGLEQEQTEAESLRQREKKLRHQPTKGEKANAANKARLDDEEKRKEIDELKRKLSGELTPEEKSAQELDDQLEDLKKQQQDAEAERKWERKRKPLNPDNKSLSQLLVDQKGRTRRF